MNVYKIPTKERQEIDSWAVDEISVSKMLFSKYLEYAPPNIMKLQKSKEEKNVTFKISSILSAQ